MQITKQRCVVCLKALAAAFGLVLFDQITKLMVVENLKDQSPFVLLDGISPFSSAADLCCPDFLRRVGELYRPDKSGVCCGLFLFCTHRFPHL